MHRCKKSVRHAFGFMSFVVLALGLMGSLATSSTAIAASAIFGREELFTLNSGNISAIKSSGFTTVILFVVDVETNGDLNFNGDHLIITNGVYMGDSAWPTRLAALKTAPSLITRIEVCTGGSGAQSWANIKSLIAAQGTSSTSILYRNFQILKSTLGIDAICNDDEVAYDATSAATFNKMITTLGMKNTLCPYNNVSYWQSVFNNSTIDAIYLQCYDGGAGNDPATWNGYFGGFKVAPGDWNNDSVATVQSKFATWSPVISGGFMWQLELIGDGGLAAYARAINLSVDPLVITPTTGFSAVTAYNLKAFPMNTPFTLSNASPSSIGWSVVNTSSWLNVSSASGTLASGATATVTASLNTTVATNLAFENYFASLVFSNKTSGITQLRNFTLNTAIANWPVALNGFNAALLASNNATAASPGATAFDLPNNICFYQQGLSGSTRGLPLNGVFSSQADNFTAFQLGPFGAPDALILGNTYPSYGTLTLSNPDAFNTLTILAASANGGGQGRLVLNFSNGTKSPAFAFNAQDWFNTTTNVALQGFGRLQLGSSLSIQDNGSANPNLYQTTINLAALGLTQPISSITFTNPTGGGSQSTAIFGVSGMSTSVPVSAPAGLTAIPGTNATAQLTWNASPGALYYHVKQSVVSGNAYATFDSPAGTNSIAMGLANGSIYYYVVSAVGVANESANSIQVSAMPGSYVGWIFGANPIAYWPLNETSGTIAFDLVHGSNGVYAGGYTPFAGGAPGAGFGSPHRAMLFNGSSGYAQIPRLIGDTNFSIVFWLKTTATGGTPNWYNGAGLVDGEVAGTTGDLGVALVGNKIGFGIGNPDTTLTSSKSVNDNGWHQVIATRNAGNGLMSLYIDGQFDSSLTGPTGVRTNSPALRIGSIQTGTGFFSGSISDVTLYQQTLATNQITTLYSAATGLYYNVTLTNALNSGNLQLSWPGNGKLLEATNLSGPWTTNVSASPVTITPNQTQKFYRIRSQ